MKRGHRAKLIFAIEFTERTEGADLIGLSLARPFMTMAIMQQMTIADCLLFIDSQ